MSTKAKPLPRPALQAKLKQAIELHQGGYLAQADLIYREILQSNPQQFEALHLLGVLCAQTGKPEQGAAFIRQSLEVNPHQPSAHSNLGNALLAQGRAEEAAAAYQKAIALKPDFAEAHCNRGNALRELGRQDLALASYDKALALNPRLADVHHNRATALRDLGRLEEALASVDKALALNPAYADAHLNRGAVLSTLKRHDEALQAYDRALALRPQLAPAYCNRGNARLERGELAQAVEEFRQSLALDPSSVESHRGLGVALQDQGDLDGAYAALRQAITLKPAQLSARSNLLFAMTFDHRVTPADYLEEARRFGQVTTQAAARPFTAWAPAPAGSAPLKVGIVSGDLKEHPVGFFLEGVLPHLDPTRVQLVAYPTSPEEDALTARLRPWFAGWRPLTGLNDEQAARAIHGDGVHVLLDLSGHTAGSRLSAFAWRPAPVQAAWLGYLASTGLPQMDWLIADPVSVPEGSEAQFTEQVWRLPETANSFTPPADDALTPGPLPALARGFVTFGCFQATTKVTDDVLTVWSQILAALPQARLRVQNRTLGDEAGRAHFQARLAAAGLPAARVDLAGAVAGREAHLAAHAEADIILDTFPYPGITTTCEALWMGVPTLTLAGQTLLSRQGASLLGNVGLQDWVAQDRADYVQRAVRLSADLAALDELRQGLRAKALASPLFNGPLLAQRLTDALHGMWEARSTASTPQPATATGLAA